ncbi:alginate lyase [Mangrovactinospora gilvigrisea]|uniref:Alginate lyase n=1 Tax=Mangrovactinospora gilvigrisea TaxID=1428644 RepID=A0A1J7CC69_9ACTN|nr:alginate lyase [Mangrovactinospora gilvigrisea]
MRTLVAAAAAAFSLLAGALAAAPAATAGARPRSAVPRTVVMDGSRLAAARAALHAGDPRLRPQLDLLLARADQALTAGPWTVMDKDRTPPSGDKHDYMSQAPYWWASRPKTADNPQGCPYVQRDGQRNPEINGITDHDEDGSMMSAVDALTLAWYYTGRAEYAQRAAHDLQVWFLDPATRMNPNMNFAQGIPCLVDGRGIGIIEFSEQYTDVLDDLAILDTGAPGWTPELRDGLRQWNTAFLDWLLTSANGKDEAAAANNHGSFYDMLVAGLQLATGDRAAARATAEAAKAKRLAPQLAADGSEPQEITRTRSFHYSVYNLEALTRLAQIAGHAGVDLWHWTTPSGGSILRSVDFLIPAATGAAAWPYPELSFTPGEAGGILRAAADHGDRAAAAAVPALPAPTGTTAYWELRPSVL